MKRNTQPRLDELRKVSAADLFGSLDAAGQLAIATMIRGIRSGKSEVEAYDAMNKVLVEHGRVPVSHPLL